MGDDNDNKKTRLDDKLRKVGFGWHDRFGFHLTGLSQGDVKCIAVAFVLAIAAIALTSHAFGFTVAWDRVSTLWQ